MADLKWFAIKTRTSSKPETRTCKLINKLQMDKIKLKRLSRDGFAALAHKQWQKINGRPHQPPVETMLQAAYLHSEIRDDWRNVWAGDKDESAEDKKLIKSAKKITQSSDMKKKLEAAKSKTSDLVLKESTQRMSRTQSEINVPIPHGFRYHANGDERVSSSQQLGETEAAFPPTGLDEIDLLPLKKSLVKGVLIHARDEKGEYRFNPVLNKLLRSDLQKTRSAPDPFENLIMLETEDERWDWGLRQRVVSEPIVTSRDHIGETPVLARDFLIRESNKFRQQIIENILKIDHHLNQRPLRSDRWLHSTTSRNDQWGMGDQFPTRGSSSMRNKPGRKTSPHNMRGTSLIQAKSSFNMRYGVSSQILTRRKSVLDECRMLEEERTARLDVEIEEYLKEMRLIKVEKDRKMGLEDTLQLPKLLLITTPSLAEVGWPAEDATFADQSQSDTYTTVTD